ncbi:MAG: DUF1963 domain-containing protein [Sandaracinus sp.]|nr:DUF1963 domain-containing protein [Sandaracinus sp.]MCB9621018.1 DUF1963 domain-containing protein [Sandaracinus sp.]MCB9635920.1 DUF1963 domain-containing protein [Sandaracinus sp.]
MTFYDLLEGATFVSLRIDTDACAVHASVNGEPEALLGTFPSREALCDGYPALWREVVESHGGEDAFATWSGEPAAPLDLRAALAREVRRAAARAAADDSAWEARLAAVRAVLAGYDDSKAALQRLPKRLRRYVDLSPQGLIASFEPVIAVERVKEPVPLGASKVGGHPHLPKGFEWPRIEGEPTYLLVQLALAEVAACDVTGRTPTAGMLYAFVTETGRGLIVHTTEVASLAPHAPAFEAPDYMKSMLDEARLRFVPSFYFLQTSDTNGPRAVAEALGQPMLDRLADALGVPPGPPCDAYAGDRLFGGDPVDWSGMGGSHLGQPLLAQLSFGDGHQSIGVHPDDLRIGVFVDAVCRYCGT